MTILVAYGILFAGALIAVLAPLLLLNRLQRRHGVRLIPRVLTAVAGAALLAAPAWFLATRPEFEERRWRNQQVGRTLEHPRTGSIADRLAARLGDGDTLIVVSLSGGGSRAAYFSAAVLEQLRHVSVPGPGGTRVPLVSRIDAFSTVSGGSLAGAYFAANAPLGPAVTDADWSAFFGRFKSAMAHDYEADVAWHMLWPTRAPRFLLGMLNGAETLADDFDVELFQGRSLRFRELMERERHGAPVLIVNTTEVRSFSPVAFTLRQPTTPASLDPIGSFQNVADLNSFRVGDAVAASSAFPGLGWIRVSHPWTPQTPTQYFADGGLVDNSGLLSLYAHVYDRSLFEQTKGRLKRIVVIAVDASSATREFTSLPELLMGIYERGQTQLQRFVVPDMLRRATEQDLEDLLVRPEWSGFEFLQPEVLAYSNSWCQGDVANPVPTAFRLSAAARQSLDRGAKECADVLDTQRRFTRLIDGSRDPSLPMYEGVFGPGDETAWHTLFDLAQAEYEWLQTHKQWATIAEIRQQVMAVNHPAEGRYDARLEFDADALSATTGFDFASTIEDGELRLSATPVRFGETGWVSLVVVLPAGELAQRGDSPEARSNESIRACLGLGGRFHGGDLKGRPALATDPVFRHAEVSAGRKCL